MNTINVTIDFTKGINKITGINLITGDYASTKMVFEFDRTDGTKVLEIKNPSGEVVYLDEIVNNEVLLARVENGLNYSIFETEGRYIYEVSLYNGDSKLTSVKGELPVAKEQVIIDDEVVEPYLPLFDELMQEINTAITETNNLNVAASKVDTTTTITITRKDGTSYEVEVLDGEKGDKGDTGAPGAVKAIKVNELPTENIQTDAMYLVPSTTPGTSNLYDEYMYIDDEWEIVGRNITIDLQDYVKNTDYAGSTGGVIKAGSAYNDYSLTSDGYLRANVRTYEQYQADGNNSFIGKGTLENVLTNRIGAIDSVLDAINGEVI